jgi:hypothetical protein
VKIPNGIAGGRQNSLSELTLSTIKNKENDMDKPMTDSRFQEICAIVLGGGASPNIDGVSKEELLHYARVAMIASFETMAKMVEMKKEICVWKFRCYILVGTIVLSCLIDLLKLAEVI